MLQRPGFIALVGEARRFERLVLARPNSPSGRTSSFGGSVPGNDLLCRSCATHRREIDVATKGTVTSNELILKLMSQEIVPLLRADRVSDCVSGEIKREIFEARLSVDSDVHSCSCVTHRREAAAVTQSSITDNCFQNCCRRRAKYVWFEAWTYYWNSLFALVLESLLKG